MGMEMGMGNGNGKNREMANGSNAIFAHDLLNGVG